MQEELLEAVASSGKPTVLVLMTGRANSIGWAKENVDAILNVWEPGQMGGQAIAEVLSGKVNPSGKLPVTMPRNVGQVPTVYNHKHSQYSRLFATNETGPLWPFGFGLSYCSFTYGKPSFVTVDGSPTIEEHATLGNVRGGTGAKRSEASGGAKRSEASERSEEPSAMAKVTITVTNDGPYDGAEVVQLYIRDEYASVTRPVKELKAFKRVFLKNGESMEVSFDITPEMLQCFGADNKWIVEPGDFTIMVGSSSDDDDLQELKLTVN
jgi:beta-glucosidase